MKKYLKYLKYIIRHKWYVMIECFKMGLYWRGIVHDLSKLLPSEFVAYAKFFYGKKKDLTCYECQNVISRHGQCGINFSGIAGGEQAPKCPDFREKPNMFDMAWLKHQKRNKHHWQWWMLPEDNGGFKLFDMPDKYGKEMLCDWIGAGKAQGFNSPKHDKYHETREWYQKNKRSMSLSHQTRCHIENTLNVEYLHKENNGRIG
jgi:hypothetical protein